MNAFANLTEEKIQFSDTKIDLLSDKELEDALGKISFSDKDKKLE